MGSSSKKAWSSIIAQGSCRAKTSAGSYCCYRGAWAFIARSTKRSLPMARGGYEMSRLGSSSMPCRFSIGITLSEHVHQAPARRWWGSVVSRLACATGRSAGPRQSFASAPPSKPANSTNFGRLPPESLATNRSATPHDERDAVADGSTVVCLYRHSRAVLFGI